MSLAAPVQNLRRRRTTMDFSHNHIAQDKQRLLPSDAFDTPMLIGDGDLVSPRGASNALLEFRDSFTADEGDTIDLMANDAGEIILRPHAEDVLLGRGKSNQKHPGNMVFRALINQHRASYIAATNNAQKKEVTERVLSKISGRFLKRLSGKAGWLVITGNPRRVKVAQALQYRQRLSDDQEVIGGPMISLANDKAQSTFSQLMSFRDCQLRALESSVVDESCGLTTNQPLTGCDSLQKSASDELQKILDLFEPYKGDEPRLCTRDELLWALGYPVEINYEAFPSAPTQRVPLKSNIAPLSFEGPDRKINPHQQHTHCGSDAPLYGSNFTTWPDGLTHANRRGSTDSRFSDGDTFNALECSGLSSLLG